MEIKGKVAIEGFTRICDLDDGTTFVFCDESELMLKGSDDHDNIYAIRLSSGEVYDVYNEDWHERPVRQIKTILTIRQNQVL